MSFRLIESLSPVVCRSLKKVLHKFNRMSTVCRLATYRFPLHLRSLKAPNFTQLARTVTLKPIVQPKIDEDFDAHNMKLQRPQSPHLSIYALELHTILSITHRFTGGALTAYSFLLGASALVLPQKVSYYLELLQAAHINPAVLLAAKFILVLPFTYHFVNGIRHLVWDTGRFLTIPGVYKTGYIVLALTILTTLGLLCL